jgi:hypothetical protein
MHPPPDFDPRASTPIRSGLYPSIPSRGRSTSEVADALVRRAADTDAEVSSALQDFIAANATRRFDTQLALPLRGVA